MFLPFVSSQKQLKCNAQPWRNYKFTYFIQGNRLTCRKIDYVAIIWPFNPTEKSVQQIFRLVRDIASLVWCSCLSVTLLMGWQLSVATSDELEQSGRNELRKYKEQNGKKNLDSSAREQYLGASGLLDRSNEQVKDFLIWIFVITSSSRTQSTKLSPDVQVKIRPLHFNALSFARRYRLDSK